MQPVNKRRQKDTNASNFRSRKQWIKSKKGFTVIELLMALTLIAILTTAVAFAFDASVKNYHANQGIYKTVNTARQALLRITNDLRSAQAVQIVGTGAGHDPADLSECTILLNNGSNVTYRYNKLDDTLYYDDNNSGASYVLCKNVTNMTFPRSTDPEDANIVRSVRIVITVIDDLGEVSQTLAAAAVVRKNM